MADTDVLQAIRIIDDKIASLQKARDQLANAFGIDAKSPKSFTTAASTALQVKSNGHHEPSGRKVQLAQYLLNHGPASRSTIVESAGLPEGTVSYCLNDKRFFIQSPDGNWNITEFSRRGLERGSHNGTFVAEGN